MKIFIFEEVEELTDRYHPGGALVVIAENETEARELIKTDQNIKLSKEEWEEVIIYNLKDETVLSRMFIFPDAGCC